MSISNLPATIRSEHELDEILTRPSAKLIEQIRSIASPLVILGAGGKMGFHFARLAQRAARQADHSLEVIAVSRFGEAEKRDRFESEGVRTVSADLQDPDAFARLPDTSNVLFLVGLKFGTSDAPWQTWTTNTWVPALTARRYAGARIVVLSTGNVYPFVDVTGSGSREDDDRTPLGEYANAAVARERVFENFSRELETPLALIRLNYAVELRYGVLVDIAAKVAAGEPLDVTMGHLNCIWQGDACDMILRCFQHTRTPPETLNITGVATLGVRTLALRFAELLGKEAFIAGEEAPTALLSDTAKARAVLGEPATPIDKVVEWVAAWIRQGGRLLGRPTGFQVRDGRY